MNQARLISVIVATTAFVGCGNQSESSTETSEKVLVSMKGLQITETDFAAEVNKISPFAKNQFSGAEGKRRMLERMVQNELLYTAARALVASRHACTLEAYVMAEGRDQ